MDTLNMEVTLEKVQEMIRTVDVNGMSLFLVWGTTDVDFRMIFY